MKQDDNSDVSDYVFFKQAVVKTVPVSALKIKYNDYGVTAHKGEAGVLLFNCNCEIKSARFYLQTIKNWLKIIKSFIFSLN